MRKFLLVAVLAMTTSAVAMAAEYESDPAHSSVNFKVRHMMVSNVNGKFDKFTAKINYEAGKPESWNVLAVMDAASVDTGVKRRDDHLRSADFFDVKKYPNLMFKSTKVTDADDHSAKLEGDLTIHGVTRKVVLDVTLNGEGAGMDGKPMLGFSATTKVDRKDFGLTWNKALDKGGVAVGDEIQISIEIEAHLAAELAAVEGHGKIRKAKAAAPKE